MIATPALDGIVVGLDEQTYHAHHALSSTQARKLLESPAKYRYSLDHPQSHKKAYDVGTLAHTRILGVGSGVAVIPTEILASNGAASTKESKAFIADAYAQGLVPVKQAEYDEIVAMSESVLKHPNARPILESIAGREVSLFAEVDGVPVRTRFDIYGGSDGGDLKSARDASPKGFNRSVATYGYHIQEQWYRMTHAAITGEELETFKFIVVESTAPYLVGVYDLDFMWEQIGREQTKRAIDLYRQCTRTGVWPGYGTATLTPPSWAIYENEEEEIRV
jgi:hypothetical protein